MSLETKKILIAEDERPLAKALSLKFTKTGAKVTSVYNGQEALKILQKEKFDYILLDLMMPIVGGFEVLEFLNKKKINTPVSVLSNLGQEEDVKHAKNLGAKNYFVKADSQLAKIVEYVKEELEG